MITLDYSLNDAKNGGKITAFTYSHGLNELCGSWSASIAGGNFTAGDSISFDSVMRNGIISRVRKDSSGLWHLEGYDAGINLMRTLPDIETLPAGTASTVILSIANHCGITLEMADSGLSGFNVRSLISGSTCAEAVLELAMFSGMVAFIGNNGKLYVQAPIAKNTTHFTNVIDDSGSDFDLDGYATQVTVILRKSSLDEEEDEQQEYWEGTTPPTSPNHVTYHGSFPNGYYSMTMLEPFGVAESVKTIIERGDISITTEEEHSYEYKHKTIMRDNQEYVLFAFIETGYTLTKTTEGTYSAGKFKEITTESMSRSLSRYDAVGVPDDWDGEIDMVDTETITRFTVREGGKPVTADMPDYAPPFDSQIERKYSRQLRGRGLVCEETEKRYEARQVGTINPVKVNGKLVPHFMLNSKLAIQTHSTPQWVEVDTFRTYYEQYDKDGNCVLSTQSEYCDDGSKWLTAHAISDTGDEDLDEYQKSYAKFSQDAQGLEVSLGTSIIPQVWHFLELRGRTRHYTEPDAEATALNNVDKWFSNGEYLPFETCPHFDSFTETCNVFALADTIKGQDCFRRKGKYFWDSCTRAVEALKLAREQEEKQLDAPIIGTATAASGGASVGYKREFFIDADDKINNETAKGIANNIASNILAVKGIKGLRKTVTIPYDPNIEPDGNIIEVSHDWENLTTSVTYRTSGNVPDFLVAQSVSGIADFVAVRENSRLSVPKYGVVSTVKDGIITVNIGSTSVKCTTKLNNLGEGDNVLVIFPAGNKLRGQVISRL